MRFLFKLAFLGFLGLLVLPSIYPNAGGAENSYYVGERVSAMQLAMSAATVATRLAQDFNGLCERDKQVCAHGSVLVGMAMERAQHGARIAMSLIAAPSEEDGQTDGIATGSIEE